METDLVTGTDALRHFLVSLAFRFRHVTGDTPDGFGDFEAGADIRTPRALVRHMTAMILLAHRQYEDPGVTLSADGRLDALEWEGELGRFLAVVRAFDGVLARGVTPTGDLPPLQIWRGPLLDTMTHVGQLATLRRLAGAPVERAGYARAAMPPLDA